VRIGPERIGENLGVAAVVLGAGGREAITEAVELLWIDGVNLEEDCQDFRVKAGFVTPT
jgi:hypothetical protein